MIYFLVILSILFIVFLVCMLIDIKHSNKYKLENELFRDIMCNYINKGVIIENKSRSVEIKCLDKVYTIFTKNPIGYHNDDERIMIYKDNITVFDYTHDIFNFKNKRLFYKLIKRVIDKTNNDTESAKKDKLEQFKSVLSKGK